jgi:hypothetical protein
LDPKTYEKAMKEAGFIDFKWGTMIMKEGAPKEHMDSLLK